MIDIIMYKSDDGTVHEKQEDALKADIAYWRKLGEKWLKYEQEQAKQNEHRQPYHERQSHQ